MKNLEKIVQAELDKIPELEIFKVNFEKKYLWIKLARATSSNILHHLTYKFTKNPIFTPVDKKTALQTLKYESSKLKRLYEKSIQVPKVVYLNNDFFALEDCGKTVHEHIKYNLIEDVDSLLVKTMEQLANLHNINEYHGASQIKNFTYQDGKVYLIDFEESFDESIDLKALQFRDLFLFMFSIAKYNIDTDYKKFIELYIEKTGNDDFFERFKELLSKFTFLMNLAQKKIVWKFLDKDSKSVYRLFKGILNTSDTKRTTT